MDASEATRFAARANAADRPRYEPLVSVLLAAACGIALDRYAGDRLNGGAFPVRLLFGLVPLTGWFLVWRGTKFSALTARRIQTSGLLLLCSVLLTAAAWHDLRWRQFSTIDIARYARAEAEPACVEVIAQHSPEAVPAPHATALRAIPAGERSRIEVQCLAIRDEVDWRPAAGNCLLMIDGPPPDIRAGDRLRVYGALSRETPTRNPGEFDFAAFARSDRRLVRLQSDTPQAATKIKSGHVFSLGRFLDAIRAAGVRYTTRVVGPQRAALANAILLGSREGLTREETQSYMVTGTIHLLVVSGMNVAILAAGLLAAARCGLVSRRHGLMAIMAFVLAYAVVSGWQPPIIRAAVVAVLWCMAAWSGRWGRGYNALAAAALLVLALNPADLFRAGPQLSFLAVATLIWVNESLPKWRHARGDRLNQMIAAARPRPRRATAFFIRWNFWLLVTTTAVWLASLPLVLMQFHVLTPVTIAISPAVWIVVTVALWSGFLMLAIGWILPPLGYFFGSVCDISLSGLEQIVRWAEAAPGGHVWLPGPPAWWVVVFYAGLLVVMLWRHILPPLRWQVATLCAWLVIGLVPPIARAATRDGLDVAFISVGHGTCVVLQAPDGETLLYDAGSLGSPEAGARSIASYLWHRGITRLDGIILSHADIDHYNAVPTLLDQFSVGAIYVSPVMFRAALLPLLDDEEFADSALAAAYRNVSSGPAELQAAIDRAGVPLKQIWAGDRLNLGDDISLAVLHPPRRGARGNDNANSITLAVEYAGRRLLLPGDLESPGLDDLMAELPLDCDLLLAPHHGSARSDPPGFATWCTPEWVVVSCGNDDVRPALATYERAGAMTFQTSRTGAVEFHLSASAIRATTWSNERIGTPPLEIVGPSRLRTP